MIMSPGGGQCVSGPSAQPGRQLRGSLAALTAKTWALIRARPALTWVMKRCVVSRSSQRGSLRTCLVLRFRGPLEVLHQTRAVRAAVERTSKEAGEVREAFQAQARVRFQIPQHVCFGVHGDDYGAGRASLGDTQHLSKLPAKSRDTSKLANRQAAAVQGAPASEIRSIFLSYPQKVATRASCAIGEPLRCKVPVSEIRSIFLGYSHEVATRVNCAIGKPQRRAGLCHRPQGLSPMPEAVLYRSPCWDAS